MHGQQNIKHKIRSLHSATTLQSDSTKTTRSRTRRQFSSMYHINFILEDGARRPLRNVGLHGVKGGTRWRSWLRHCATSQKVAGSIPDGVSGFFSLS